jgi:prepilin-type N-terminal cleavage/methylation domain-containing protein
MKLFNKSSRKGFTLVELLIVIAIMGVLAAAIMVAINPSAKINAAKDSNLKSDISSISNAMQAYYTNAGTVGTAYYPAVVADLVPSEMKSEPKLPSGSSYTVTKNPAACTTAAKTCTDIAVSAPLNNPLAAGNVWCWRSSTGVVAEVAVAACTAP